MPDADAATAATPDTGARKLRELILYISRQSQDDEAFGMTKLNKLLFYSDFGFFVKYGRPLTGEEYRKLENGPAPRAMPSLIAEMQAEGELALAERDYFGRTQKQPTALREPDLSLFSGQEIGMVEYALHRFRNMNASQISEHSHQFAGWKFAREGETIPYAAALLDMRPLTETQKEKIRQRAERIDLTAIEAEMAIPANV